MAANFPGPYDMRFFYTVQGRDHTQKLNCAVQGTPNVGDDSSTIVLQTKDLVGVNMETAADAWAALIADQFNDTDAVINRVELWRYEPLSSDAIYVSSYQLGVDGTSAGATAPASQTISTFRTVEGGVLKINLMDTVFPGDQKEAYPAQYSSVNDIFDYVVADDTWILGRDTSYPVLALNWLPGINERLFKQIYRD